MTAPTGWPGAPGYPENPERSGAHRLRHQESGIESDKLWSPAGEWIDTDGEFPPGHADMFYDYLGPCPLPAEVGALVAAGQEAMRAACAVAAREACLVPPDGGSPTAEEVAVCDEAERRIRALPLPDAPGALARMIAEAAARGMERAAGIAERVAVEYGRQECCGQGIGSGQEPECCGETIWTIDNETVAAAIRAAAKEIKA